MRIPRRKIRRALAKLELAVVLLDNSTDNLFLDEEQMICLVQAGDLIIEVQGMLGRGRE